MTALEYWLDRYLLERRQRGPDRAQTVLDGIADILAEDDCEMAGADSPASALR